MITRQQAFEIVNKNIQNKNLVKHCLAVEAAMKALANHFHLDENKAAIIGLLHDADWEACRDNPSQHTKKSVEWLKEAGETDEEIIQAILSHNFAHTGENPPQTKLEWCLYTCDELTGLIVATALVMPDKKLSSVTVESVLKKFKTKGFAAGVHREQIQMCEEQLGIKLDEFIKIIITSMQQIASQLEL